ncbi:MAG: OB-fold domain-containing protein, partial [Bacillota bacterium]
LTMAVAASLDCARGFDTSRLNRIYFATTSPPYQEKQSATTLAGTLGIGKNSVTMDVVGSLRSGSSAFIAGLDAAEKGENVLVAISDHRRGAVNGQFENLLGDGAAAFIIGNDNVVAEVLGVNSVSVEFIDTWRSENFKYLRNWEERFALTQAYVPFTVEAGQGVMKKTGLKPEDFSKVVIYGFKENDSAPIAKQLGFTKNQIQSNMIELIGNTGAACAPMALVAALENSQPEDNILFLTYGEGSDAIVLRVTESIKNLAFRRGIKGHLDSKKTDMTYGKYLIWQELVTTEPPRRPPAVRPSLPDRFRNQKKILGFYGSKCTVCDTPQFPPSRVCINCHAVDQFEDYKFLGKKGRIATFTIDYLAATPDPPTIMAVVDFEGGGRFICLMTDCEPDKVSVGMEIEMSFRKLFVQDGLVTYFWKAVPKR